LKTYPKKALEHGGGESCQIERIKKGEPAPDVRAQYQEKGSMGERERIDTGIREEKKKCGLYT